MKYNILIIDDEPFMLTIMETVLQKSDNIATFSCKTVEKAKSVLDEERIDLVITDIFLDNSGDDHSETNGIALMKYAQEKYKIPVIVISGNTTSLEKAKDAGASEILEKPYDREYLNILVNHYLKMKK